METGNFTHNEELWYTMLLDTPFRGKRHSEARSAEEAALLPGNAVKSLITGDNSFPKYTGILVYYKEDQVCIRGHGDFVSPKFVWYGTKEQYHQMWVVD